MREFRATQHTPQHGALTLHVRFIGKNMFMKGTQSSSQYTQQVINDLESRGATIKKGNGGWVLIDIIKDHELVKLGDIEFHPKEAKEEDIETILFDFFLTKYREAKFAVQEII